MRGRIRGEALARVSTEIVQLYAKHWGKGPTRAKTHAVEDTVICVLRDVYTKPERTLIDVGDIQTVYRMRDGFRRGIEAEACGIVEEVCGRKVVAHLSTMHTDPDMAAEIFVLETPAGEVPATDGLGPSGDGWPG